MAEEKTERAAPNLQRTSEELDGISRTQLETQSTLERARRTSERHFRNHLALQGAMGEKLGRFAREKANAYHALQIAEQRIAKLKGQLSNLSDDMTRARNQIDATEIKNRRLQSLAELLGKAMQREKNARKQLAGIASSEHLAAL